MKLTVTLTMDNDAFDSDFTEAGRILRDLANKLESNITSDPYDTNITLMDVNGNRVGKARIN